MDLKEEIINTPEYKAAEKDAMRRYKNLAILGVVLALMFVAVTCYIWLFELPTILGRIFTLIGMGAVIITVFCEFICPAFKIDCDFAIGIVECEYKKPIIRHGEIVGERYFYGVRIQEHLRANKRSNIDDTGKLVDVLPLKNVDEYIRLCEGDLVYIFCFENEPRKCFAKKNVEVEFKENNEI